MENKISDWIKSYVHNYNENKRISTQWKEPLIAFISSEDLGFQKLREEIGDEHLMPKDILSNAASVIVYFLPFVEEIHKENSLFEYASDGWAQAYVDTNNLIREMNEELSKLLSKNGYDTVVLPPTHNFDKEKLISWWSHKHIAWLAGLGNFGIHQMLITEAGSAGRFGSVVTSIPVNSEKKVSEAGCLWYEKAICGKCIENCTFGALSLEGFDRKRCYEILLNNAEFYESKGISDACGKCMSNVPCSSLNPIKKNNNNIMKT